MNTSESGYHTPLPGSEINGEDVIRLRAEFLAKFRPKYPEVTGSIPTACALRGGHDTAYLESTAFLNRESIYFFLDGKEWLRKTTPAEVMQYLDAREPWEDYDICLFDDSLQWAVGITHNDTVLVVH